MHSYGRVLVHVCGQVSIKVTRITKADELGCIFRGAHIHAVILGQDGRLSPIYTEDSVLALHIDADG